MKFLKLLIILFVFLISGHANAVLINPDKYMVAGGIGDTWEYERFDGSQFTWTLSEITSGSNSGRFNRGDSNTGMIYDMSADNLSVYQIDSFVIDPPIVIGETELGQVFSYPDEYLFWKLPNITVQAGTYTDVLAWVFLDNKFDANIANYQLGLDPQISSAVTDISFYVQGVGEVAYYGVDAATGKNDGLGHQLISYTIAPVPEPSIIALFVAGLLSLGLARRKHASPG